MENKVICNMAKDGRCVKACWHQKPHRPKDVCTDIKIVFKSMNVHCVCQIKDVIVKCVPMEKGYQVSSDNFRSLDLSG
jgi:hypothetical protein